MEDARTTVSEWVDIIRRDPLHAAQLVVDRERALLEMHRRQQHELGIALLKIEKLEEEKRLARAERFGTSSEANPQYALFDEAERFAEAQDEPTEDGAQAQSTPVAAHARTVARRSPLPANLPRRIIEHPPLATRCPCGSDLVCIGTKVSEQLDIVPRQLFVIEHRRGTWKCPCCVDAVPVTAPMPPQPIPKSFASPGLLAHVASAKYVDGMPLYRLSTSLAREGIHYPRQTMATGMVQVGELARPLVERLMDHALGHDQLLIDETRVQVLKEPDRRATAQSWMWVIRGGPTHAPVVRFHYEPTRSGDVPTTLLKDYRGYLHTDGYAGYHALARRPEIIGVGCWAHARRRFIKAQKALPKGTRSARLETILGWIGELYRLEREWEHCLPEERQALRNDQSRKVLREIEAWLPQQHAPPKTLFGEAMHYLKGDWSRLQVFLQDGRLRLDTNLVENAIRPFAVGRRAWLFSDSVAGARSSAVLYSLVETAKANGLNPHAYLKHVFMELPKPGVDLDRLLPWNVDRPAMQDVLAPPAA
jgi:transposase